MREPTVAWWPGKIPAGYVCDELLTSMDLLPTFAKLAGAAIPSDRVIDGKDISAVLTRPGTKTPHDRFFYHQGNTLRAVRSGPWKLYVGPQQRVQGKRAAAPKPALYHLLRDIGETKNLAAENPDVVKRLTGYLRDFEQELGKGDKLSSRCRPAGLVENSRPLAPRAKK